jgi:hypothetical protein
LFIALDCLQVSMPNSGPAFFKERSITRSPFDPLAPFESSDSQFLSAFMTPSREAPMSATIAPQNSPCRQVKTTNIALTPSEEEVDESASFDEHVCPCRRGKSRHYRERRRDHESTGTGDQEQRSIGLQKKISKSAPKEAPKGEPLFRVYSPQIQQAQTDLLVALHAQRKMAGMDATRRWKGRCSACAISACRKAGSTRCARQALTPGLSIGRLQPMVT